MDFATTDIDFLDGLLNFQTLLFLAILILLIWGVYTYFRNQNNNNQNKPQYINRTSGANYQRSREEVQRDMLEEELENQAWQTNEFIKQNSLKKSEDNCD